MSRPPVGATGIEGIPTWERLWPFSRIPASHKPFAGEVVPQPVEVQEDLAHGYALRWGGRGVPRVHVVLCRHRGFLPGICRGQLRLCFLHAAFGCPPVGWSTMPCRTGHAAALARRGIRPGNQGVKGRERWPKPLPLVLHHGPVPLCCRCAARELTACVTGIQGRIAIPDPKRLQGPGATKRWSRGSGSFFCRNAHEPNRHGTRLPPRAPSQGASGSRALPCFAPTAASAHSAWFQRAARLSCRRPPPQARAAHMAELQQRTNLQSILRAAIEDVRAQRASAGANASAAFLPVPSPPSDPMMPRRRSGPPRLAWDASPAC